MFIGRSFRIQGQGVKCLLSCCGFVLFLQPLKERRSGMKKLALIVMMFGLLGIGSAYAQEFTLKSSDLSGQLTENQVFSGFGCNGKNISPSLTWVHAPKTQKALRLPYMILTPRQGAGGGTGLFLTSPPTPMNLHIFHDKATLSSLLASGSLGSAILEE